MRRTVLAVSAILLTAACSSTTSSGTVAPQSTAGMATPAAQTAPSNLDATAAFKLLSASVPTAKMTGTVTAANDPNSLLGRPHEYTSKITFSDSRIPASDTQFAGLGDVDLGGAIEAFANAQDATTREQYLQAITAKMSMFSEYDYVHGTVLIRVSHYLTPDQAKEYETAVNKVG
ncbi:MAG: hypothetical protein JO362_22990 [Streptomycetaceae bacterium]|nr:hypothetical protein [Streptomycetaceae bacterium]